MMSPDDMREYYQVDEVDYYDNLEQRLAQISVNGGAVLLMKGVNSD